MQEQKFKISKRFRKQKLLRNGSTSLNAQRMLEYQFDCQASADWRWRSKAERSLQRPTSMLKPTTKHRSAHPLMTPLIRSKVTNNTSLFMFSANPPYQSPTSDIAQPYSQVTGCILHTHFGTARKPSGTNNPTSHDRQGSGVLGDSATTSRASPPITARGTPIEQIMWKNPARQ